MGPATALHAPPVIRVLLVEDDEADAFLVTELLLDSGASLSVVDHVRSVADARQRLDQGGVDCVLLDLGLPDAQGFDGLRQVLAVRPRPAVLVLTGLADEHRGVAAVAAGAQDYLVKGQVDGQLLARSIRYAVERRRADEQLRRLYASELRAQLRSEENARLERGLLPHPDVHDPRLSIVQRYRPGRDAVLGGDFFDVVETTDGRLHVLLGDVAGHGPDEAALGVSLRIAWRTLVLAGIERERLLPTLEEVLVRERRSEEVFATVAMVVVEPDRGSARLALAGHPAPLLLGPEPLQLPDDVVGPALGVLPGVVWGGRVIELAAPWRLALFSDGLVEGLVEGGPERLGVEGLLALLREDPAYGDTPALLDHALNRVRDLHGGELADDVAILVVHCTEGGS